MQEVTFFFCQESFESPSGGRNDIYSDHLGLELIGLKVNLVGIKKNGDMWSFDRNEKFFIKDISPSFLFFSGFISAERLFKKFQNYKFSQKKIINIKDLHFFRELRAEMLLGVRRNHLNIMTREINIYKQCDLILSYSKSEISLLKRLEPNLNIRENIFYNPNFLPEDFFKITNRLVFGGNFDHHPNCDAIENFVIRHGDMLHKRALILEIYGANVEKLKFSTPTPGWIKIKGLINDPINIYRHGGFFLAPLRYGAGIKIKLIEAAMCRLPIIATPEAAEDLPLQNNVSALIYKNKEDLNSILDFIVNESENQLRSIANKAYNNITNKYNPTNLKIKFVESISTVF